MHNSKNDVKVYASMCFHGNGKATKSVLCKIFNHVFCGKARTQAFAMLSLIVFLAQNIAEKCLNRKSWLPWK